MHVLEQLTPHESAVELCIPPFLTDAVIGFLHKVENFTLITCVCLPLIMCVCVCVCVCRSHADMSFAKLNGLRV